MERSTTRGVKLTPPIQIEKVPIIVRGFFALPGTGKSRQMEGKNLEENKARDKWCSLCVSCGERPRLINRRIDTRYTGKKLKMAGFLSSKKKTATINLAIMTHDQSHCRYMNFLLLFPPIFPSRFLYRNFRELYRTGNN